MTFYGLIRRVTRYFAAKLHLQIRKDYRFPVSTLNLLDLAVPAYLQETDSLFFVQVGANDGKANDPLNSLIARYDLSGLLIEPQPLEFQRLKETYAAKTGLSFERCAVADHDGRLEMLQPRDDRKCTATGLEHIKKHGMSPDEVRTIDVPCYRLKTLLDMHEIETLQLLVLDAEGMDHVILSDSFDQGITPDMLFFEIRHIPRTDRFEIRTRLGEMGYDYCECGDNCLAVRKQLF